MARAIVGDRLPPIEEFAEPGEGSTAQFITVRGQRAVKRSWINKVPLMCAVYVDAAAGPFVVMVQNNRFPGYAPCDLARPVAEAALRRHR